MSEETKRKISASKIGKKLPPVSEERKQKLRESNLKTWADPVLRKKHGEKMKIVLSQMSKEKKNQWYENILKASRTPENKDRSKKILENLRKNPEWIKKQKEAQREMRRGMIGSKNDFFGKKHSEESLRKNREAHLNKIPWNKGKPNPSFRGALNPRWKGGITCENIKVRSSLEYKIWRRAVFKRDDWTCVLCKERGGKINADHIKSFAKYSALRFDLNNGRVLCVPCHKKTHNYGRKKDYA
jgi:hypothetical protein